MRGKILQFPGTKNETLQSRIKKADRIIRKEIRDLTQSGEQWSGIVHNFILGKEPQFSPLVSETEIYI